MRSDDFEPVLSILGLEARAARLEGHFAADPEIGTIWRAQVGLTEACRSVSLEDISVFEGDVVSRKYENQVTEAEQARGGQAAISMLRFIMSPGDIAEDTAEVMARAWRAAARVTPDEDGIDPDFSQAGLQIRAALQSAPTPFLGALRAAIIFQLYTDFRAPSADRLIFMAAEHHLRGAGQTFAIIEDEVEQILGRNQAGWICTPSIGLTQDRFRAWSPSSPSGMAELVTGISSELSRGIGLIPILRRWRRQARDHSAGKRGNTRFNDLIDLVIKEPILTSPRVRDMLSCSDRTAITLLTEAEEAGLLLQINKRDRYRVWAHPGMADRLRMRTTKSRQSRYMAGPAAQEHDGPAPGAVVSADQAPSRAAQAHLTEEEREERINEVLSELDKAMAAADEVLRKYRKPARVQELSPDEGDGDD